MVYFLAIITMLVQCYCVVTDSTTISSILQEYYKRNHTNKIPHTKTRSLDIPVDAYKSERTGTSAAKTRFKRQQSSGAGKFTEAAQLPQLKVLRLFLTMFKNLWADSYTGGSNPFHHYVPKPTVQLYKEKILKFFFPDVGVPSKTK